MKNIKLATLLISTLALGFSVAKITKAHSTDKFIHVVYFWYNDDVSDNDIASFEASMKKLAKVKSISKVYYGPPADTDRGVIDNTYQYAWINHFKSKKEHDHYQKDPVHLKMIADHEHMWKKVVVYDNVNLSHNH